MLLEIKNLSVEYFGIRKNVSALRNLSLSLEPGETLGVVGESGCGKSTLALAILRLIQSHEGKMTSGEIYFDGKDILTISENEIRKIRGKEIGIIFQDPFSSLNPVLQVGEQISEALTSHEPQFKRYQLKKKVFDILHQVQLSDSERIYHSYPHQISGGQRQRVMIAIAIANRPKLLIADEPTTALDVTVQKEILELLLALKKELKMAILFITHHIGFISRYTENLVVLYAGEVVEYGKTSQIINDPQHPYSQALLSSLPKRELTSPSPPSHPLWPGKEGRLNRQRLPTILGSPPDLADLPSGCIFHPRCPLKVEDCKSKIPLLRELEEVKRKVSCHLAPFKRY